MSFEVIDSNNKENEPILVGNGNSEISPKVYQDIYHQITGRTENISQKYNDNLLIDINEIKQLNHKINQLCDIHEVIARNETITVFHEKERKEQFTSFEKFLSYNSNTISPTLNIVLQYNFAIVIPGTSRRAQQYKVTIKLTSRETLIKQIERDAPPFMRGRIISSLIADYVAEISIDYTDYVVARAFVASFDEWINGCNSIPKSKLLRFSKKISHLIPVFLPILITYIIFHYTYIFFKENIINNLNELMIGLIIFAIATFILFNLVKIASQFIESVIDEHSEISYININKGDEKIVVEQLERRRRSITKIIASAIYVIILGIIAARVDKII